MAKNIDHACEFHQSEFHLDEMASLMIAPKTLVVWASHGDPWRSDYREERIGGVFVVKDGE